MFAIDSFKMLHLVVMLGLTMFELQDLTILIVLQLFFAVLLQ